MKYILIAFLLSQILVVPFVMFVDKHIDKLDTNNKFRLWWKRNICTDEDDEFLNY
jgi:hypothetical protein